MHFLYIIVYGNSSDRTQQTHFQAGLDWEYSESDEGSLYKTYGNNFD